jgi:hypothetical protein
MAKSKIPSDPQKKSMMKYSWIVISIVIALLAGCDDADDSALLVLNEKGLAAIHFSSNSVSSTASGSYTIRPSRDGHLVTVDADCGQLKFTYIRPGGLSFVDDEQSNSAAYRCGFGTQPGSAQWKLALKPLTGPSLPPPEDWPR